MPTIEVYLNAIETAGWHYKLEYDGKVHLTYSPRLKPGGS